MDHRRLSGELLRIEIRPKASHEISARRNERAVTDRCNAKMIARINNALGATGHLPLQDVECFVEEGGVVTLRGKVPSFYLKLLAQSAVRTVRGVSQVRDELHVRST